MATENLGLCSAIAIAARKPAPPPPTITTSWITELDKEIPHFTLLHYYGSVRIRRDDGLSNPIPTEYIPLGSYCHRGIVWQPYPPENHRNPSPKPHCDSSEGGTERRRTLVIFIHFGRICKNPTSFILQLPAWPLACHTITSATWSYRRSPQAYRLSTLAKSEQPMNRSSCRRRSRGHRSSRRPTSPVSGHTGDPHHHES